MKKFKLTKIALIVSVCLLIAWGMLGTGATLAWFTDTTEIARNSFLIGTLDLGVSYKNDVVTQYTPMDSEKPVFNDKALYEPGYTQVVYLKIDNNGEIDFDYKLSVDVNSYTDSVNYYGAPLHLANYLRFGVLFGESEAELDRALARENALEVMEDYHLNTYSQTDSVTLAPGETRYAALIVYMPEGVGNAANHRGDPPTVELGVTVYAQQAGTPIE